MPKTIGNENTESNGGVSSSILNDTTLGSSVIYSSLQTVGNLQDLSVSGGVTFDSTTFHVDEINDRVGIKTVSPQYPLHVEGQTYVNGNVTCTSVTNSGNSENQSITTTGYQNYGDYIKILLTDGLSYFRFTRLGTNTSPTMYLSYNQSKTSGSAYAKDTSANGASMIGFLNNGYIYFQNSSTTETSVPSVKMYLDTAGDLNCNYNLSVDGLITCGSLLVDTNTFYVDSTNNRVGILTTSPQYPLHCNGNAYVNGTCAVTGDLTASSSLFINGLQIQNNVKNIVALSNCTTYGVTTSNAYGYYPNFDMTSNSQNGYVVTASSNSTTAYQMFHSNTTSWNTSQNYSSSYPRLYNGTQSTYTLNADYIYGDHITITFPNPFHLVSFVIRYNDSNNYTSTTDFCASIDSGSSWIRLNKQNLTINNTTSGGGPWTYTYSIPTVFQNYTWNAFRLIVENIQTVSGVGYGSISYFQLFGYPASSSNLTYIPSNVEIGNSLTPNAIPDTDYALTVNGNVLINGYIKRNYFFGETVCTTYYGSHIGNLAIVENYINVTTYKTIFQVTYEPKITTSMIGIECDCRYSINGSGGDEWWSQIAVNGTSIIEKRQLLSGRSGALFPISGYFITQLTSPITKTISIQVKRGTSDDTITIDNAFSLKITEIFN